MITNLCTCCVVHDDWYYLRESIGRINLRAPLYCFVSTVAWNGRPGSWHHCVELLQEVGAQVVTGEWHSEFDHRRAAQEWLLEQGFTHALIPDGDEIIEPQLLETLFHIAESELADRVYVEWNTYWKTPEYVIRPRERFTPCMLIDLRKVTPVGGRNFEGGRPLFLSAEHGIVHHLSYVGPDARIRRKMETWGHANEVVPGWWENVWKRWDSDKLMRNLHPTHPEAYGFAERVHVPDILLPALARYHELAAEAGEGISCLDAEQFRFQIRSGWPTVSVVIPVHGGREDLHACLTSLDACRDLLHEVILIDNASSDRATEEGQRYEFVRTIHNDTNLGFAKACNQGVEASTGELVLFLNSDTVVPRSGLVRLIEALQSSGSIAAAGPYTNNCGHFQRIDPTYTSLNTLDLFADDFAIREASDMDTDMLVGFCLAARRSVLDELGGFDERFGLGTFEDNDLCYRMRRAGYRPVIAARSFVHHQGSKSFGRLETNVSALLATNHQRFTEKWKEDLESGFASTLSGLSPERIVFHPERQPERRRKKLAELARRADISLCMIVKDEERVLGDCLKSARPFFREIIIVDTGSTDTTVEIAKEYGAKVVSFLWTDSFAEARNVSLEHANGRWVFWLDADDTLPLTSGEAILEAALNAPPEVMAFVVPVQFVDDGTHQSAKAAGTQVDHVKLFRNLPGFTFEGRIHEQILPSIRRNKPHGLVSRCNAVVLHSGYDTSEAGQQKKRARDYKLLELDLAERPDHPFVLFNFGMTDHYCGEHEAAIDWLQKCLAVSEPTDSHVRKAYALLAISLKQLGRTEECRAALEEGLAVVPADPELHFHLGNLDTESGNYAEAVRHFEAVLQAETASHFSSLDVGVLGFKSYHNLAGAYRLMGDYKKARKWFTKANEAAPGFLPSTFLLFDAALENGDFATAKAMLARVRSVEGTSESWATMGVKLARELAGEEALDTGSRPGDAGEQFLRDAVANSPEAPAPRLLLARHLLHTCREPEAAMHLHRLAAEGVAEAAYFLGVMAVRSGKLPEALSWMERAYQLNPEHAETGEQILNLRRALSLEDASPVPGASDDLPPTGPAIALAEALTQVAADLELDADELLRYAEEDLVGGFGVEAYNQSPPAAALNGMGPNAANTDSAITAAIHPLLPAWPGGSVWEVEGRVLYALVRALKPQVLVEVGSLIGCSTSHLAAACKKNGFGRVYAVDPMLDFSRVDPSLLEYITPIKADVFTWTPAEPADFLFEDGAHTPGFTGQVLAHLGAHLDPSSVVLCHDFRHGAYGRHISREFADALSAQGKQVGSILIEPSNCGLGYAWSEKAAVPDSGADERPSSAEAVASPASPSTQITDDATAEGLEGSEQTFEDVPLGLDEDQAPMQREGREDVLASHV